MIMKCSISLGGTRNFGALNLVLMLFLVKFIVFELSCNKASLLQMSYVKVAVNRSAHAINGY